MKYIINAFLITVISLVSYTASAKDGDFMGAVSFDKPTTNTIMLQRYMKKSSIDKSHSGVLIKQKVTMFSFQEKLLSAADK
ncbi:hypothetical protein VXS02_05545 [Photobacterium piscicola]|uniref:Uncharacterized protein n=1 Tax=Photobacterium piscicola TaxID=1378299 RepID=A0ABU6LBU2_9GAMM|nr:hypothetical protein [Photobacterium piscicola]MEC6881438.1 hypothetical protein [Photobacterium piscicola]MEC6897043.1 hypothetical protein [Photobacterium piscicola]